MTYKDEFDHLVDEALSEYRDAEPLAGLESRVLWRIGQQRAKPRKLWFRWGRVAVGAVAIVFAVWLGTRYRAPKSEIPASEIAVKHGGTQSAQQLPSPPTERSTALAAAVRDHRQSTTLSPIPTLAKATPGRSAASMPEQFPAPAPLTENERAFVAALNRRPDAVRTPPESDQAVAIAQIEIKPLSNADNPGEN